MNERDIVLREMLRGNPDLDEQHAEGLIDALVDAAAHELADEQRAMAEHHNTPLDGGEGVSVGDLINHVDPHVPFEEGGPAPHQQLGVGEHTA